MRMQPQWLASSETGVALALCAVFDLDPESDEAVDFIRYTRESGQNTAEGNVSQDMVYITVSPIDSPAASWASNVYANGVLTQTKIVPLSCQLVFYGLHATELSEQAWSGLMVDAGAGSPRHILRDRRLVIVPRPDRPVSTPEVFGGVRRNRSDLRLRLDLLQTDQYSFEPVEAPPAVSLRAAGLKEPELSTIPRQLPFMLNRGYRKD